MTTLPTTDRWREQLAGAELAYAFLSQAFYAPPNAQLLEHLAQDDLFADWPLPAAHPASVAGLGLLRRYCARWSPGELAVLSRDYAALFVGPGPLLAPLWESVYLDKDHLLFGAPTFAVRAAYEERGLEAPRRDSEPDDHLGLELAFLAQTSQQARAASERDDAAAVEGAAAAQRAFLSAHLMRWAGACLGRVIEGAGTDYYRGLAHLALGTLAETAAALGLGSELGGARP